jgi:hypothetical protein
MNKKTYLFILLIFSKFFTLNAKIIEVKNISEILNYVDGNKRKTTLVLFDIDNTLTEPVDDYGGDLWFSAKVKKEVDGGLSYKDAVKKILPEYFKIQKNVKVKPVETAAVGVVQSLQQQKVPTLALTTRSEEILNCTYKQLKSIKISFDYGMLGKKMLQLTNQKFPAFYYKGLIGCDRNNKGVCLKEFLEKAKKQWPALSQITDIVFIDDKEKYLKEVEEEFKDSKIFFTGLRYSYLDEKVKNYVLPEDVKEKISFFSKAKNKVTAFFRNPFGKRSSRVA